MLQLESAYRAAQLVEIDRNFDFFQSEMAESHIDSQYYGKFALLKGQKIVDYFDTRQEAYCTAMSEYEDHIFSIQEVSNQKIDLGFYSRAIIQRES